MTVEPEMPNTCIIWNGEITSHPPPYGIIRMTIKRLGDRKKLKVHLMKWFVSCVYVCVYGCM